ncbi:winged helix-turn-helix transcriptional regulator [Nonomuraea harbinensis]|uniref:Winged helix-turn-helix transcriptional regulator n=1 Tax=Nonomuraea harbinensis TaxID=1286938 RepID=A0ABW1BKH8_9ACTN|nr:winged helix-turn-helix transcriptional regulator [Nonomuraea harbinensis]
MPRSGRGTCRPRSGTARPGPPARGSPRTTLLILRELLWGEERFSAIARGVPRISPPLLAARLRELGRVGLVERHVVDGEPRSRLTEAGRELEPLVTMMGAWGIRWMRELRPDEYDPVLLMVQISRECRPDRMPEKAVTVQVHFKDAEAAHRRWWLVLSRSRGVDVCDSRYTEWAIHLSQ